MLGRMFDLVIVRSMHMKAVTGHEAVSLFAWDENTGKADSISCGGDRQAGARARRDRQESGFEPVGET